MEAPNDIPLAAATLLVDEHEILRRLGSGGIGAVYEARSVTPFGNATLQPAFVPADSASNLDALWAHIER